MKLFKEKTYTLDEYKTYLKVKDMKISERITYELGKEIEKSGVELKPGHKLFNSMAYALGAIMFIEKTVYAAAPSTGFPELDGGAWKAVQLFQALVFWVSLIYTLKCLLLLAVKGEGEWKKVAYGFFICVADYLAPWLWSMVPKWFTF